MFYTLTTAVATNLQAVPTEPVQAATTESALELSQHSSTSFLNMVMQADIVVQLVMLMLFLASLWSWAIIFDKLISLKTMKYRMQKFETEFWSGTSLEKLFKQIKGKQDHPMAMVFVAALDELQDRANKPKSSGLNASIKERIHQCMQVASNKSIEMIERNLNFLATVGSSAPFVGLFGTVWGIMVSFQAIAISKNTTLAVVAPGIAEALMATALGLAAAIPAVIFYNKFACEVNRIGNRLEDFSMELSSIISRELDNS